MKNLTDNENRIIEILNRKKDNKNIWISARDLVDRVNIPVEELEISLYLLQIKGLVRVSMDSNKNIKITTEEKVQTKLSNRIVSAFVSMESTLNDVVDKEEYEEAAKLRDWIIMSKDHDKIDKLFNSIIEDIDNDI